MTILDRLAASNTKRLEETARMSDAATNTYIGQAVTDSDNGSVHVILSDDAITPEWSGEGTAVEVPTTTAVRAGDNVLVQTFGGHVMTSPVVTGVVGRGDELQELAEDAEAVANAVSQHFWTSTTGTDSGAHVTEVTQDEWNDAGGASYHSGANSLWNSLGMLFRDGLTNLMAVLTSGVAIYDGLGNAASNIVASFTDAGATIGKEAEGHAVFDSSGMHVYNGSDSVFDASYTEETQGGDTTKTADIYAPTSQGSLTFRETSNSGGTEREASLQTYLGTGRLIMTDAPTFVNVVARAKGAAWQAAQMLLLSNSSGGSIQLTGANSIQANGIEIGTSAATTATRGSAASSIGVNSVRKYGNVVSVTLAEIKLASALSSGSTSGTVATVPTGYRPATNVYAAIGSTGAHGGSYARITTEGVVTIRNSSGSSIATSAQLCFTLTYVI
ncbi:MAG: hypothetical protein IKF14_02380 [Atopobiaceae bacterium]|nr:hypothetical protein [Atopobiaceae bacterium]